MTLDAFYCVFLSSYHVWRNVRGINDNYNYYSSFAVFTVRLCTVLLKIFLSGMQYLWSRDLKICRFNRPIFSKRRIITGLILVCTCSLFLRSLYIIMKTKLPRDHQTLFSTVFKILLLALPQIMHVYFVVGMIKHTRSKELLKAAMELQAMASRVGPSSVVKLIRRQTVVSIKRLSIGSQVSPASFQSDMSSGIFSPQTCNILVKNVFYEASVTQAIIAISISDICVYTFATVILVSFAIVKNRDALVLSFAIWDVFQILNASCHLPLLMAMLPSFRKSFKNKWLCLWKRGQIQGTAEEREETDKTKEETGNDNIANQSSASESASDSTFSTASRSLTAGSVDYSTGSRNPQEDWKSSAYISRMVVRIWISNKYQICGPGGEPEKRQWREKWKSCNSRQTMYTCERNQLWWTDK